MLFTRDKKFYFSLKHLAIPMALSNLITFLITLTDSIIVGKIGDEATASVFVGGLVATTLQMFISGIEGGITVGISQHWGKEEKEAIKRILSIGGVLIFLSGAVLCALSFFLPDKICSLLTDSNSGSEYLKILSLSFPIFAFSGTLSAALRSIESPGIVTFATLSAFVINLVFDYLFVFGKLWFAEMGILGAAIATIIARAAELLILSIYTFLKDKKIKMRFRELFIFDKKISIDFLKYTTPVVIGQLIWIINTLFASFVFASFGNAVITGLSVATTLNSLSYVLMNGLSGAVGIIIGKCVGDKKIDKLREYTYTTEAIFIILGILTSLTLLITKNAFISIYNISDEAVSVANSLISVLALTIIGTSYQSASLIGIVRGGGDTSFILKNDAFFIFLAVIPLTVLALKLSAPIWLVFLALKSDQIIKCIPAAIKIHRFNWAKDITE